MRYIVANWKQYKTIDEARGWLSAFKQAHPQIPSDVTVVVAAPFVLLPDMKRYIEEQSIPVELGAQNVSPKDEGAFTGEVGAKQLKDLVQHIIIGHSERRMYFGETNQFINLKVQQALEYGMHPFVCIADQVLEDGRVPRQKTTISQEWFVQQIRSVFEGVEVSQIPNITLVYEPISAISTFGGQPLTGQQAVEAINDVATHASDNVAIMYGGSVNSQNIREYWQYSEIAGVMPGSASLAVQEFLELVNSST